MFIPVFFPLPKTRKGIKILMIVLLAVCVAGLIAILATWSADQAKLTAQGQPDFNTVPQSELEDGKFVSGTIGFSFGTFAETYEETLGQRTSSSSEELLYVIPAYTVDEQGYITFQYFLGYLAQPGDFETMDAITDYTWGYRQEPVELPVTNGQIIAMDDEFRGYFEEWINEPDADGMDFIEFCAEFDLLGTQDPDVIASKMAPFLLKKTATAGIDFNLIYLPIGIGAVCLVILLVVIFRKKPLKGIDPPEEHGFSQLRDEEPKDTF